jgi:L-alanine-DL-glutamate epimerase-like enolase superfamily enzyme
MRILSAESRREELGLSRPYTIASRRVDSVENFVVVIRTARHAGFGAAAPDPGVTGETPEACAAALSQESLRWIAGEDLRDLERLGRTLADRFPAAPAARAAVDMALHDLLARHLDVPLVRLLGRAHERLPTSVTIGIKPAAEALAEAEEYTARGFRVLKVKLGLSLAEDLDRLARLRAKVGASVRIRADANCGYTPQETAAFFERTERLDIEFLEQPGPRGSEEALGKLPEPVRRRIAGDESVRDERDALRFTVTPRPFGIFNVKLMKCGGIRPARRIAALAETAGIELMWGCMDESAISITAALHAALASPATRYLDLDGSLDLARDVVRGGFVLEDGMLRAGEAPGLGVEPL